MKSVAKFIRFNDSIVYAVMFIRASGNFIKIINSLDRRGAAALTYDCKQRSWGQFPLEQMKS